MCQSSTLKTDAPLTGYLDSLPKRGALSGEALSQALEEASRKALRKALGGGALEEYRGL